MKAAWLVALVAACAQPLGSGDVGKARIAGTVRGTVPLAALPPVSDRDGNLYLLAGTDAPSNLQVFIGTRGGGFFSGCRLSKGDQLGAVGWVGFDQRRSFYWAGGALVAVTGFSGDCRRVLDRDPTSGADLRFRAVFPWVNDVSTKTTLLALVQAPTDPSPFTVTVNLNAGIYTDPRGFEPGTAHDVKIYGVGASSTLRQGFVYLAYDDGDAHHVEGRFYDEYGALTKTVGLEDPGEDTPEYVVLGSLQANDDGLVAGALGDGRMVFFDQNGGHLGGAPSFQLAGVHVWKGDLYAVGSQDDGSPVVSRIDNDTNLSSPDAWTASEQVAKAIRQQKSLIDDRSPPRRDAHFDDPRNAIGPAPFVAGPSPGQYAQDETLVLIAGPTYGEGQDAFTQIAIAPAGIDYP